MFFNSQGVCLLLLLGSFARAIEPKCEEDCDGWCKTMCYYQPQGDTDETDLIERCTQLETSDEAKCEVGTPPGSIDLKTEENCQKYAAAYTGPCHAYRFIKLSLPDGADGFKYVCELLSACRSREEITGDQADQQDNVEGSGRKCDDPANTVMCDTFPFSAGNNIVRWICEDKELTNKNDPYYYKQAVGTVCKPTHECHDPSDFNGKLAKCIIEKPDADPPNGIWVDVTSDGVESTTVSDLGACNCPKLRIPAAQGTNLACTKEPRKDENGDFILGEDGNECALFCDNYFIADLTCEFAKDSTAVVKTTWVASWDGNRNEVKDCLSCWEGGCPPP